MRPLIIASFEQCSQLFCFTPHEIHNPTVIEFLSSKSVVQRLTENERWRAVGILQNGISRLEMWQICPVVGVHVPCPLIATWHVQTSCVWDWFVCVMRAFFYLLLDWPRQAGYLLLACVCANKRDNCPRVRAKEGDRQADRTGSYFLDSFDDQWSGRHHSIAGRFKQTL